MICALAVRHERVVCVAKPTRVFSDRVLCMIRARLRVCHGHAGERRLLRLCVLCVLCPPCGLFCVMRLVYRVCVCVWVVGRGETMKCVRVSHWAFPCVKRLHPPFSPVLHRFALESGWFWFLASNCLIFFCSLCFCDRSCTMLPCVNSISKIVLEIGNGSGFRPVFD